MEGAMELGRGGGRCRIPSSIGIIIRRSRRLNAVAADSKAVPKVAGAVGLSKGPSKAAVTSPATPIPTTRTHSSSKGRCTGVAATVSRSSSGNRTNK